jgi:hypothetical protein
MRRLRLPGPSLPDLTFGLLALFVPLLGGMPLLNSDGDLGRHLRLGEHMLTHGLLHEDLFSYTKYGEPFIGHEWLSEIAFALAHRLGGMPLVAVASGLLIACAYAYMTSLLLRRGVDPLLAYVAVMLAVVLGSFHWLARPHLFTLLGAALLIGRLEQSDEGARPWTHLPLFAAWVNVHGGFLFGLVLIAIYLAGDLVEAVRPAERAVWLRRARRDVAALGFALLGVLINPYGLALPLHVLAWFKMQFVIDNTVEYLSPNFHQLDSKVVLVIMLVMVLGLTLSRQRPTWPRLLVILATIAASLIYQRNIPLMGIVALSALALHLDREWRMLPDWGGIRGVFQRDSPGRRSGPWAIGVALPLLLLTVTYSPLSALQAIPGEWSPRVFPVEAVRKAREAKLQGRIYNEFIWGGYLLKQWPEMKVFIDGQTDFYGEALTRDHWRVGWLQPGWRDVLRRWKVELVLIPSRAPLAHELARDPEWTIWYCDSTAVILNRKPASDRRPTDPDSSEQVLNRCAPVRDSTL